MIETENSSKSMIFSAITKPEGSENLVREQKKSSKGIEEFMTIERKY